jgi:hypothetical protein
MNSTVGNATEIRPSRGEHAQEAIADLRAAHRRDALPEATKPPARPGTRSPSPLRRRCCYD